MSCSLGSLPSASVSTRPCSLKRAVGRLSASRTIRAMPMLSATRLRAATRDRIGVGSDQPVLGFFGQPPDIPGHETAFEHLVSALTRKPLTPLVLLREHPKSPPDLRARHTSALERAGANVHDA